MYMTLETDYAIRIVGTLSMSPNRMGAKAIAETTCVTLRFSLKILRKLVASGIVRSYKGAQGGYEIARPPEEISLNDILEAIEGPFALSRCVTGDHICSFTCKMQTPCPYRRTFTAISDLVRQELSNTKISTLTKELLAQPNPEAKTENTSRK